MVIINKLARLKIYIVVYHCLHVDALTQMTTLFRAWFSLKLFLQCFFDTILEFMKLEKVEIGGLKGRLLSSKVVAVYAEFSEHLTMFGSKTYDALDPEDPAFELDYADFHRKIRDLDRRLASILCQAFDDCCNLESVFKVRTVCVHSCLIFFFFFSFVKIW